MSNHISYSSTDQSIPIDQDMENTRPMFTEFLEYIEVLRGDERSTDDRIMKSIREKLDESMPKHVVPVIPIDQQKNEFIALVWVTFSVLGIIATIFRYLSISLYLIAIINF